MGISQFLAVFATVLVFSQVSESVDVDAVFVIYNETSADAFTGITSTVTITRASTNVSIALPILAGFDSSKTLIPNLCATGDVPCAADATCKDLNDSVAQCKCNPGYNQTASTQAYNLLILDGTLCPDIDECPNATICGPQTASCVNTPGSYECTCKSGYEFINTTLSCDNIDECATSLDNCHANATCMDTPGSFNCTCQDGYSGNGTYCEEFNECTTYNYTCGSNGTCLNTIGSYTCNCDANYTLNATTDPLVCVDIDECANTTSPCVADAYCSNLDGGFSCTCNSGFTGDPYTMCSDIDECVPGGGSNCHANATCTNTPGSFTCSCNTGFAGTGVDCTPADNTYDYRAVFTVATTSVNETAADLQGQIVIILTEISSSTPLSFREANVTYEKNITGTTDTQLVFNIKFNGSTQTADEFTALLKAHTATALISSQVPAGDDFNECANSTDNNCSPNAVCTNTNGSFTCACPNTYADLSATGEVGTTCTFPVNFTCHSGSVEVWALARYFQDNGFTNETRLMLGNCSATNDSTDYWKINGACNPEVTLETNSSYVFYKWNLTTQSGPIVSGFQRIFPITCSFMTSQNLSVSVNGSQAQIIAGEVNNVINNVDFTAKIYKDAGLTSLVTGDVKTNDMLYFKISTGSTLNNNFKLVVERFITSAAEDPSRVFPLIENSCPVATNSDNEEVLKTLSLVRNEEPEFAVVAVQAHFMSGSSTTTSSLTVTLCNPATSNCTVSCSKKRRRRSAHLLEKRDLEGTATVSFSRDPEDICRKDCGNGLCVLDAKLIQQCVCYEGTFKHTDGRCQDLPQEDDQIIASEDRTTLWVLVGLAIVVFVLIAVALAVFVMRRQNVTQKEYGMTHINGKAI